VTISRSVSNTQVRDQIQGHSRLKVKVR